MDTSRIPIRSIPVPAWISKTLARMSQRERAILIVLIIIGIVSAFFSVSGYVQRNSHLIPQEGGTYTEAVIGQPRYIMPVLASANDVDADISALVYSSLFTYNNDLELVNDLATGYDLSPSETAYTVSLRQDVQWHDGRPFTADDVVFTIRSIQTKEYGSPLESSFQGVTVEKVDDYTVRFALTQPYAPFLSSLTVGIAPRHVWETISPKNAPLADQMLRPVGTGPFQFEELVTRRKTGEVTMYRLIRNESYHGKRPYLDEFRFEYYTTHEDATAALTSGKVDGVGFLPLALVDQVKNRASLNVHQVLLPQYIGLFFNEIQNDLLGNAGIRAALTLATDRDTIVNRALGEAGQPLDVPIPHGKFTFDELNVPTFDPEVARQNLEESDWKDEDGDGIREKDGKELAFTITTTDWPEYVETAELIAQQWQQIGIDASVQALSAGAIQQSTVGPRDYEILLYGEILTADPDPYPFWHSTQTRAPGLNLSLLKDEGVDKLLEEARKTNDYDKRKELYFEFLQKFLDLNPGIILYRPQYLFAQQRDVRGGEITQANLPVGRLNDVEQWHVRTKRVWN